MASGNSQNSSVVSTPSRLVDDDDPLHVSSKDVNGNPIVSDVLIGRENFAEWKKAMEIALSARSKLDFVLGEHPRPSDKSDKVTVARWQRCNDVIMTWLISAVSKKVLGQILHADDVIQAWKILNARYAGTNVTRKFSIKKNLHNLMQGDQDIASYYDRLSKYWQELESIRRTKTSSIHDDCAKCRENARERDEDKVIQFLMGLNEVYSYVKTHILALGQLPDMDVVYDMLITEEAQGEQIG
ncbi:hypothetical protein QQ045_003133 [Rhodiola kirilowii]